VRAFLVLIALILLTGIGILVVAVLDDSEEIVKETWKDTDEDEPTAAPDTPDPPSTVEAPANDPNRVPRVLPPDAAIEDIRDALAAEDRIETQEAYERFGRLAASTGRVRTALRKQLAATTDPRVRAIAIAAIGHARDPDNERWLRSILNDKRAAGSDRSSALLALATRTVGSSDSSVTRSLPGWPDVEIGPLQDTLIPDVRLYLDEPSNLPSSITAIALHVSVRRSADYARMIITNDGKRRAHFLELDDVAWSALRNEARQCAHLDDRTKDLLARVQ